MKIVSDVGTFVIPMISKKTIIVSNNYKDNLIECLNTYFVSKKKSKCLIYDEDGQLIHMDDLNFIHLPDDISLENNLFFKPKTIINNEVTQIIIENPEYFISLNEVRNNMIDAISDKGFIKLSKVMSKGLKNQINIVFDELNISALLQMLAIEDKYSESEKMLIILNLLIYEYRNITTLVYLDNYLDDFINNWIDECPDNVFFLIDNEAMMNVYDNCDMEILSNTDHLITCDESNDCIKILSYMNHDLIKANMSLQNEKNVNLFNKYYEKDSTFFIKNSKDYS